jgi:tungstate transport system substrate-binding protein
VRNDLILVGPAADPAGVRGSKDAVAALRAIIAGKHKLVVHASMGADTVLHDLLEAGELQLDPVATVFLTEERHQILTRAAAEGAYTLVGRIPFVSKKLPSVGLEIMVQGDPRLRRPYLVEVAAGAADDPRLRAAHQLAAYLRAPATQAWIDQFGRGRWDADPIFFPIASR